MESFLGQTLASKTLVVMVRMITMMWVRSMMRMVMIMRMRMRMTPLQMNIRSQLSTAPFVVGRLQLRTWQSFRLELDLDRKVTV